jgi:hypothetical protein
MMRAFWETDMTWQRKFAAPAIGLMIVAAGIASWAGEQGNSLVGGVQTRSIASATRPAGSADTLSPGNRLIAEALFAAQATLPGAQSVTPWPLERIAASRNAGQNWGEVFQQMKTANLLQADTLGQVVTWYQYNYVKAEPNPYELRSSVATVPTAERNYGN